MYYNNLEIKASVGDVVVQRETLVYSGELRTQRAVDLSKTPARSLVIHTVKSIVGEKIYTEKGYMLNVSDVYVIKNKYSKNNCTYESLNTQKSVSPFALSKNRYANWNDKPTDGDIVTYIDKHKNKPALLLKVISKDPDNLKRVLLSVVGTNVTISKEAKALTLIYKPNPSEYKNSYTPLPNVVKSKFSSFIHRTYLRAYQSYRDMFLGG